MFRINLLIAATVVSITGCSDKKIPISAYHILTTKLKPLAKSIMFGEACSAVPVFKKTS